MRSQINRKRKANNACADMYKLSRYFHGHPENERCDTLAVEAADNHSDHLVDQVFEENQEGENTLL